MFAALARKIIGSRNDRYLRKLKPRVEEINALEATIKPLTDEELQAKTGEFKERLKNGATLEELLPEAFAVCREASWRVLGMRHFDVQLIGGIVLHEGKITEMKTGEGKTLVATLPLYLNALEGRGAHLVTVNDYLATRDSEWMGRLFSFLGLSTGVIVHGLDDIERKKAYDSDITYGTNNEFGFDFLRDNMKFALEDMVQREQRFAIVDEVDSILIDESRTPLIISGPTEDNTDKYYKVDRVIPLLKTEQHYEVDEKARSVTLTEEGTEIVEATLRERGLVSDGDLYDIRNVEVVHHVNQALKAHALFEKDKDYIVKDGEVVIIDEFTGRMMPGRRYSDGLHQALEAKEQVVIQNESQTLASITFQNLFRMYDTLAGMTGTADTEASEFESTYSLEVIIIPTNQPMVREDHDDVVFRTYDEKTNAIVEDIQECNQRGQPVLVGTISIEKSEDLSRRLRKAKVPHEVLNAKYHEREAEIIAQAGRKGAVTIATNMAGRGTDIQLGGNPDMRIKREISAETPDEKRAELEAAIRKECEVEKQEVLDLGGLYILATERHESRRIDNQLRGRAGRQGDPGASCFYLSLQDDLMRIFGSERMDGMLQKLGLEEGEAIVHPWINKAIESAQKKVEGRNFDIRKNLLKFDDVMNDQRRVIYDQRRDIMQREEVSELIGEMREDILDDLTDEHINAEMHPDNWEAKAFADAILKQFAVKVDAVAWQDEDEIISDTVRTRTLEAINAYLAEREERFSSELVRHLEKSLILQILDALWKEHLLNMDHLKEGIHLRGYAQKDPLNEYKREAFELFEAMMYRIKTETIEVLARVEVQTQEEIDAVEAEQRAMAQEQAMQMNHPDAENAFGGGAPGGEEKAVNTPYRRATQKVGRNAPCPCGSGKKYKHCCGKL
ncbi:MAG: preprotein translocase subunit SecA [Magnetococcales bacterium]|nr:preprotein translocase subunit SecA [Magnetococcales bacterium]